ncbi:MAG: DNA translocase FtsK 4TM domain-containing protein [Acutalibacteraceae bacterium]
MAAKKTAAKSSSAKKKTTKKSSKPSAAKSTSSKPEREYTPEQQTARRQKAAIALMAVAALLIAMAFIEGESAWLAMHNFMFGVFGTCTYVWPVMLIYVAVMLAMDKTLGSISSNLIGIGIFILLICSAIHIFSNPAEYLSAASVGDQIKTAWSDYDVFPNSGALGALMGSLLAKMAGKVGAAIINIILLVVSLMYLTGLTLSRLGMSIAKPFKRMHSDTTDRLERSVRRERELAEQASQERASQERSSQERTPVRSTRPVPEDKHSSQPLIVPPLPTETAEKPSRSRKKVPAEEGPEPTVFKRKPASAQTEIDDIIEQVNTGKSVAGAAKVAATVSLNQPSCVPELPTQSVEDKLKILDLNKKPSSHAPETEPPKEKKPADKAAEPEIAERAEDAEKDAAAEPEKVYRKPPISCLAKPVAESNENYSDELKMNAQKLLDTLESFNVRAKITEISRGPSVTRYELQPDAGVRINKITNLADDIALRLAAPGIRIEAPIPNKAAIGIEVPNKLRSMVYMREIIETPQFKNANSKLNVALGKDIAGNAVCADLSKMPHLLIAGTTGSGKSVCINTMIVSILYNATPDEVKLLMIDPKQVEFTVYNGIAHLAIPVVSDPRKASGALTWAVNEMQNRYKIFSEKNVRDIKGYNKLAQRDKTLRPMHQIVIFIDELSDLMMVAPNEVEDAICRLAQMARAAGMHLVIATQRPSVDVITGIIKANIPSRIALSVSSSVDSRTILDMSGAEKLIGNGDMLFNPIGSSKPTRIQGCFISDEEVEDVVDFIKHNSEAEYDEEILDEINRQAAMVGMKKNAAAAAGGGDGDEPGDELFPNAVEVVLDAKMASTTLLQRKLKLGYARAARLMDELESKGIIGPFEGSKPRQVLITKQQWMEKCALSSEPVENEI